jgi:3-oxoacyl-[acyl-carrier-protein] synthase III
MPVRIKGIASVLPPRVVSSREVEETIASHSADVKIPRNIVQLMTGIKTRHYVEDNVNTSDLAAEAARRVLGKTGTAFSEVDLLIFASAGQDLVEPATSHIIQDKIGTNAAVLDIKNACNSFLNGVQVAEALILAGQSRCALVVTGETPSKCIKWKVADRQDLRLSFPGYTFGDAGAAALLEVTQEGQGIFYRNFCAISKHWSIGTLAGGGSMHPRGDEHTYFRGEGTALKDAFMEAGPNFLYQALQATNTTFDSYARILVHQVTIPFLHLFLKVTGIPAGKVVLTLPRYGNMAAATLPFGFDLAESNGEIRRGDRVLFIGLAGGISLGIVAFQY